MAAVVVRAATSADASAIADLLGELGYPAPAEAIPGRLERMGAETAQWALVAEVGGQVVGLATAFVRHDLTGEAPFARLAALVVQRDRQGAGIGRVLVEAVENVARDAGCTKLEVTSGEHRPAAHAFYRRLGFEDRPRRFVKHL